MTMRYDRGRGSATGTPPRSSRPMSPAVGDVAPRCFDALMDTETKTRYLVRAVDRWERGRPRTAWHTHHRDCNVPARGGAWRSAGVAMSNLPDCCAHLDGVTARL